MRCFRNKESNEIICIDTDENIIINLSQRKYETVPDDKLVRLVRQLEESGDELEVFMIADHRYFPRTYYAIYRISFKYATNRYYYYFMEIYDGSSASYSYYFCRNKSKCLKIIDDLEEDNIMMY
jgi:hypothetical protein